MLSKWKDTVLVLAAILLSAWLVWDVANKSLVKQLTYRAEAYKAQADVNKYAKAYASCVAKLPKASTK